MPDLALGRRTRFCKVELSDPRCVALWRHSDAEAVLKAGELFPGVLSPEEAAAVRAHQDFVHGGDAAYREFCRGLGESGTFDDELMRREWTMTTQHPRWGVAFYTFMRGLKPRRILDLGAWTGVSGVFLSNVFPEALVWMVEPVERCKSAIARTVALFAEHPERCLSQVGDHLEPPLPHDMDLVYCGEVLEHVPDLRGFVAAAEAACVYGGSLVFTAPVEEANDHAERVHCRHLEAEDLKELFGAKRNFSLVKPLNSMHHVVAWVRDGTPTGDVDWQRKLRKWGFE